MTAYFSDKNASRIVSLRDLREVTIERFYMSEAFGSALASGALDELLDRVTGWHPYKVIISDQLSVIKFLTNIDWKLNSELKWCLV